MTRGEGGALILCRHDFYLKMKTAYPASGARFYLNELQCLHAEVFYSIEGTEDRQLKIWQNLNKSRAY